MFVNMPVEFVEISVSRASYNLYSGLVRFDWPVMVAVKPEQILLDICTVAPTVAVGGTLVKQTAFVVSLQLRIAFTQYRPWLRPLKLPVELQVTKIPVLSYKQY